MRLTPGSEVIENTDFRSSIYAILALAFSPPETETPKLEEAILSAYATLSPNETANPQESEESARSSVEELSREHLRLFVGPSHIPCPPYESVYRKDNPEMERRLVMGQSTADVRRRYTEANLRLSKNFTDLPDHIAVEMEFMHFLCTEESRSAKEGNIQQSATMRKRQREFAQEHLNPWVDAFADCVLGSASSSFYMAAANLLKAFLRTEYDYLLGSEAK